MIWVLSGTRDAREIIKLLKKEGFRVMASAVTEHGALLAKEAGADEVIEGELDCNGMKEIIKDKGVESVVDATHPFAVVASKNAMKACKALGIDYICFERRVAGIPVDDRIHVVEGFEDAAKKAANFKTIFYTAGCRNLEKFLKGMDGMGKRVVVRTLPHKDSIEKCIQLGIKPRDIIAMQGPFSTELNEALMKGYNASVLVTKESGDAGGTKTKVEAALNLNIPVILIQRPVIRYPITIQDYEGVLRFLSAC